MLEFTILKEPDLPYGQWQAGKSGRTYRPQKDDLLWKGIIEDVFEDFLCFFVPEAEKEFDLSRGFEFLSQELEQLFPPEDDQYHPKTIDKLVRVFRKDGTEASILVHIEIQDKYKEDFSLRMFTYYYRIFDKYRKHITAFAILTEPTSKSRSNSFNSSAYGTSLDYTFNLYKIADQNPGELYKSKNAFAMVVLIAQSALYGKLLSEDNRDEFLLDLKMRLAKELLSMDMPKEKIRVLMDFLKYYVRFRDKENNITFEQELEKLTGRSTTMGIEELLLDRAKHEGKVEGKSEGLEIGEHNKAMEIARELKKEGLAIEFIAKTTKLSIAEIEEL